MYCTPADLEKLLAPETLGQLADDGPGGPAPEAVLLEAIEQADREIDAYLGVARAVPLEPAPAIVANLSAKIAVYNLYRRRPHLEAGEWAGEYQRALKLLERIAEGRLSLGGGEGPAAPLEPNAMVTISRPPHFSDRRLRRF
ncbi:gp436 family protein [Desulfarculus baarsii]